MNTFIPMPIITQHVGYIDPNIFLVIYIVFSIITLLIIIINSIIDYINNKNIFDYKYLYWKCFKKCWNIESSNLLCGLCSITFILTQAIFIVYFLIKWIYNLL